MTSEQIKAVAMGFIFESISCDEPRYNSQEDWDFALVTVIDSNGWRNEVEVNTLTSECELVHVH